MLIVALKARVVVAGMNVGAIRARQALYKHGADSYNV